MASGASDSAISESGGTVTATNPALIVSGAAVFDGDMQIRGTVYGASPVGFASAVSITGSGGEIVTLDGKDHIGNKNVIGSFNVTGAINITGSETTDGMNLSLIHI